MSNPKQFSGDPQRDGDEFDADLSPRDGQGQNFGAGGAHPEKMAGTNAYEIKDFVRKHSHFSVDELKQIVVMPEGSKLEARATYIDMKAESPNEFKAVGVEVAGEENWYVPKSEVDYQLWNKIRGIDDPERTGDADG